MSTEIYYFSGTGNSLYVARELQARIPGSSLMPIVSLLQRDAIKTNGDSVGIVFPVHALTIPLAVTRFLKRADLRSAEYVFAVATRQGIVFHGFEKLEKLLRKRGSRLDAHFILNMYSSDAKDRHYHTPTESEILRLEQTVQERLGTIQRAIVAREVSKRKDSDYLVDLPYKGPVKHLMEKLVVACLTASEYIGGVNYFCSDPNCTGCGVCERVCLSQKIKMGDKKPLWRKEVLCYMCYACLNFCPRHAIQINDIPFVKSFPRQNGRYTHPYATVRDICAQKEGK